MSSKLHGLVWEGCAFTGMILSRVAVMARLADYSNDEGVSWPAIETIRRQIGARSESTVKSAIAELAKEGWLTKEERKVGGRNVSNIYRLNVEKLEAAAAAARESYKPKRKISPAKNDPLTVDPSNIDPSTVDPSNFDGSTVDKKLPINLVADFFMGSGSTVKAALALGRRAIGVELETGRFEQTVREVQDLIV